jgi:hypothetical protein
MDTLLNATPLPFLYEYAERRPSVTSTSVMNSRRLTSIKLHSLPASQATELQDIKLATNRSAGIGATVQPVAAGADGRCPFRGQTGSFGDVGSMSGLPEA